MISDKMQQALNKQLNLELYSSYVYLAMAAYFETTSYNGFAAWMEKQSYEEYGHGLKIYKYLNDVGARVVLDAIEKPKFEWKNALDVFNNAYDHEMVVTKSINELADLAVEEKDHASKIFLNWFVQEQVEELDTVSKIVDKLKLVGENTGGLFMLDRELGSRQ